MQVLAGLLQGAGDCWAVLFCPLVPSVRTAFRARGVTVFCSVLSFAIQLGKAVWVVGSWDADSPVLVQQLVLCATEFSLAALTTCGIVHVGWQPCMFLCVCVCFGVVVQLPWVHT